MIPASVTQKLDDVGELETATEAILVMRDVIIDLIGALNELERRVDQMAGLREPP